MKRSFEYDAAVVGSGPNGLAAAITLAEHGLKVVVLEAAGIEGGGARTAELTLPGFRHDVGSAIHPMAAVSPFFSSLPLSRFGLEWVKPPVQMAHPLDDGRAALLKTSVKESALTMAGDAEAYIKLVQPLLDQFDVLKEYLLGTMRFPKNPLLLASFGLKALRSAENLSMSRFKGVLARGFFAGLAAHSVLPLNKTPSAAFGLVLCIIGHAGGWPIPVGGAGSITSALSDYFASLGGTLVTGHKVSSLSDLPDARALFFDTAPRELLRIYDQRLPGAYKKSLQNYRYGPGVFKVDWALSGPIPWKAKDCYQAGAVHIGGTFAEIAEAELSAWQGKIHPRPFVILAQPSLFDSSRAPAGQHTAWAYCHVPNGSTHDMTASIEFQIERFAPGFKGLILQRHPSTTADLEAGNPNLVGGDIVGGAQTLRQIFCRPTCRLMPYTTPLPDIYLCSASTPPGAGVHGMCGFHAASAYLKRLRI
ncbi:MAG: NAD(P)/FAD-dependent oxidoreductase [Dehalococcoidia bacterium]|jgi:phytoene dehydrogenase-like protein